MVDSPGEVTGWQGLLLPSSMVRPTGVERPRPADGSSIYVTRRRPVARETSGGGLLVARREAVPKRSLQLRTRASDGAFGVHARTVSITPSRGRR